MFSRKALSRVGILMGVSLLAGCGSHRQEQQANDRVNVKAPFVNVRVGEDGGAKIKAPLTNIETPKYQQNTQVYTPTPPPVSTPVQNP